MLFRVMQGVGVVALLGCAVLALQATPLLGAEWSRARLLYAAAGAVSALSLLAIGSIGLTLRRLEAMQAALAAQLGGQLPALGIARAGSPVEPPGLDEARTGRE